MFTLKKDYITYVSCYLILFIISFFIIYKIDKNHFWIAFILALILEVFCCGCYTILKPNEVHPNSPV